MCRYLLSASFCLCSLALFCLPPPMNDAPGAGPGFPRAPRPSAAPRPRHPPFYPGLGRGLAGRHLLQVQNECISVVRSIYLIYTLPRPASLHVAFLRRRPGPGRWRSAVCGTVELDTCLPLVGSMCPCLLCVLPCHRCETSSVECLVPVLISIVSLRRGIPSEEPGG